MSEDIRQWKLALKEAMKQMPASLGSCSLQTAVKFKSTINEANKALASSKVTAAKLAGLVRTLQSFQVAK